MKWTYYYSEPWYKRLSVRTIIFKDGIMNKVTPPPVQRWWPSDGLMEIDTDVKAWWITDTGGRGVMTQGAAAWALPSKFGTCRGLHPFRVLLCKLAIVYISAADSLITSWHLLFKLNDSFRYRYTSPCLIWKQVFYICFHFFCRERCWNKNHIYYRQEPLSCSILNYF